jgi:hypothetical protein
LVKQTGLNWSKLLIWYGVIQYQNFTETAAQPSLSAVCIGTISMGGVSILNWVGPGLKRSDIFNFFTKLYIFFKRFWKIRGLGWYIFNFFMKLYIFFKRFWKIRGAGPTPAPPLICLWYQVKSLRADLANYGTVSEEW